MVTNLVEEIKEWRTNEKLIRCVCNPGLKDRHWKEISYVTDIPIDPDKGYTLERL